MADVKGLPPSFSPSSSDTDSLIAPSSAAASPAISPATQSFPSPASAYTESKNEGDCAHIHGADCYPEEGRCSVSSNLDEETVRQRAGDADAACEHQAWEACPSHQRDNLEQASHGADVFSGCGSDDTNAGHMAMAVYADAEKGSNVKQVDAAEEGQGENCRVCHLSAGKSVRAGELVKLGCACKDDLSLAHRHCAEMWFKIKGNRTCEICGSTAQNIFGNGCTNHGDQGNDVEANNVTSRRADRCWQNQPFFNIVLVCVILVLIASWLFRVTLF